MIMFGAIVSGIVVVSGIFAFFVVMTSREKKKVPVKIKVGRDSHIDLYEDI